MYGFVPITVAQALPVGAPVAVTGANLKFSVEEEQMLTDLQFCGNIVSTAGGLITITFLVDGVAVTTLPLMIETWAALAQKHVSLKFTAVNLSKGSHKLTLAAGAAVDGTIKGDTTDCRLIANRASADATMGQGVNSKVQLSM
jgi:hypothetical protein